MHRALNGLRQDCESLLRRELHVESRAPAGKHARSDLHLNPVRKKAPLLGKGVCKDSDGGASRAGTTTPSGHRLPQGACVGSEPAASLRGNYNSQSALHRRDQDGRE